MTANFFLVKRRVDGGGIAFKHATRSEGDNMDRIYSNLSELQEMIGESATREFAVRLCQKFESVGIQQMDQVRRMDCDVFFRYVQQTADEIFRETQLSIQDRRIAAMVRAFDVYGETLCVFKSRQTVRTLQQTTAHGYVVNGRAYGGEYLGCVFSSQAEADEAIRQVTHGIVIR